MKILVTHWTRDQKVSSSLLTLAAALLPGQVYVHKMCPCSPCMFGPVKKEKHSGSGSNLLSSLRI